MKRVASLLAVTLTVLVLSGGVVFSTAFANTAKATTVTNTITSSGPGTETSLSPSGCQFTTTGCTVQSNGTANTIIEGNDVGPGPFTTTLTVYWSQAVSNGKGGFCAPASGPTVITLADNDNINLLSYGTLCEVGKTGNNVPHKFKGKFLITGGTGQYVAASGSGRTSGGDDGLGNSNYTLSGTVKSTS